VSTAIAAVYYPYGVNRPAKGKGTPVAKQETVILVDDLDGGSADESVEFALDGRAYEIDLSMTNGERLRSALAPYVSAARRAGGTARRVASSGGGTAPGRSAADREQNQAIREWAQAQGMTIAERGRIPSNVLEAYHRVH
jgi:Lsr2